NEGVARGRFRLRAEGDDPDQGQGRDRGLVPHRSPSGCRSRTPCPSGAGPAARGGTRHLTSSSSQRLDELTQLTAQLVEIDSVNPALVPNGSGERRIALVVADWCERRGLDVVLGGDERPRVIARMRGSCGGGCLGRDGASG